MGKYSDAEAPAANSLKPSAGAWVTDGGRVLLIRRDDNGNWSMPGGAMDLGEVDDCAREIWDETGVHIEVDAVGGIWTDPTHVIEYTSDGEVRQEFTVIYRVHAIGGEPTTSSESTRVKWVELDRVADLQMDRSQRMRINWLHQHDEAHIDPQG